MDLCAAAAGDRGAAAKLSRRRGRALPKEQIAARLRWDWHEKHGIVFSTGLAGDVAAVVVDEAAFGPGRAMPEILFIGHASDRPVARWTPEGVAAL